ncbi:hypothetical protein I4U23_013546 [Adineta vaga]|nr:hypothetical protein I4U23_013546 [Adineta vaga]
MSKFEVESDVKITSSEPLILVSTISRENVPEQPHWIHRFSGIFYALTASFLFTFSTFMIKQLGVDLLDALLLRFFIQVSLTLAFVLYKNYTLLSGTMLQVFLQIICAVIGAGGFVIFSLAVRYVELADVNTLGYTRVVWTVVLSAIVYRERPSIGTLIALPLTFLGVIFVTQPSFLFYSKVESTMKTVDDKHRLIGFILALSCALTSATNVLLFKQLISISRDIKPSVLNLHFATAMFLCLITNQIYKIVHLQSMPSFNHFLSWRFLLASTICLITIIASIITQKAIKREHPAVFSLLSSAEIIFALILQNLFTNVRSNLYALFGSTLVISSVVVLGIARILNERNQAKKRKENIEKC